MPTNMSLNDIVAPSIAAGNSVQDQGQQIGKDAMGLANTMQDIQGKQQKQQEMTQQLADMKYNTITGVTGNAMKMSDPIFKASEKQMEARLKSANPDYQPGTLAAYRADPDMRAGIQAYNEAVLTGKMPNDPAHKQMVISAYSDPGNAENLMKSFNEQRQLDATANIKAATLATTQRGQDMNLQGKQMMADAAASRAQTRIESIHNQNVKQIASDPGIQKQQVQLNNLNNAMSNISAGQAPTPESFSELQQSVRSNLGIKGTSGVNERGSTFLKGIGMAPAEFDQFMSMKPQDITKYGGTEFLDHIKALANNEVNNVRTQAQAKVNTYVKAHDSFYSQHPALKTDYNNFAYGFGKDVLGSNATQGAPAAAGAAPGPAAPAAGSAPATATPQQGKLSANQQVYIQKAQQLKNPQTNQPYTMDEIMQKMQQKGVK